MTWSASAAAICVLLQAGPGSFTFETFVVRDPTISGLEVARFLTPGGWNTLGELRWRLDEPAPRAELLLEVEHPAERSWLRLEAPQTFVWDQGRPECIVPIGRELLPHDVERHSPQGAAAFLRDVFLPKHRPNVSALRARSWHSITGLPGAFEPGGRPGAGAITTFDGAGVIARYRAAGREVVEQVWAVTRYQSYRIPSTAGLAVEVVWTADPIVSLGADEADLELFLPVWQTVLASVRLNTAWYRTYRGVLHQISAAEPASPSTRRRLTQALEEVAEAGRLTDVEGVEEDPYEQVALSAIARAARSGRPYTAVYRDPLAGTHVRLPAGCEYAWTDGHGRFCVTDSPRSPGGLHRRERWYPLEAVE